MAPTELPEQEEGGMEAGRDGREGDREVSRGPSPLPIQGPGAWSLNRKFVLKGGQEFPGPVLGAEGSS